MDFEEIKSWKEYLNQFEIAKDGLPAFHDDALDQQFRSLLNEDAKNDIRTIMNASESDLDAASWIIESSGKELADAKKMLGIQLKKNQLTRELNEYSYLYNAHKEKIADEEYDIISESLYEDIMKTKSGEALTPEDIRLYAEVHSEYEFHAKLKMAKDTDELSEKIYQELKAAHPDADYFTLLDDKKIKKMAHQTAGFIVEGNSDATVQMTGDSNFFGDIEDVLENYGEYLNVKGLEPDADPASLHQALIDQYIETRTKCVDKLSEEDKKVYYKLYPKEAPDYQEKAPSKDDDQILMAKNEKEKNINASKNLLKDHLQAIVLKSPLIASYNNTQREIAIEKSKAVHDETKDKVGRYLETQIDQLRKAGKIFINDDPALHKNSKEYNNLRDSLKAMENVHTKDDFDAAKKKIIDDAAAYLENKYKDRSTDLGKRRFVEAMDVLKAASPYDALKLQEKIQSKRRTNDLKKMNFTELEKNVHTHNDKKQKANKDKLSTKMKTEEKKNTPHKNAK